MTFKKGQSKKLIDVFRQCLLWNNNSKTSRYKSILEFLTLYLNTPEYYKKDTRNYYMFNFRFNKLPKKLLHKIKRVMKNFKDTV